MLPLANYNTWLQSYTYERVGRSMQSPAARYACGWQTELRTPPADWPNDPSPRLFGLDADDWTGVAWAR